MHVRRRSAPILLLVSGCAPQTPPAASPTPTPPPPAPAEALRAALPPTPAGFTAKTFRERSGLVSVHLKKGADLVGTFILSDRRADPLIAAKSYAGSGQKVHGWPAVSTSMGGGVAVLVAERFQVEAVSLGPRFGPDKRDAWLDAAGFDKLAALADRARP